VLVKLNLNAVRRKKAKSDAARKKSTAREAARRLAAMGGSCPRLQSIPRRRPPEFT